MGAADIQVNLIVVLAIWFPTVFLGTFRTVKLILGGTVVETALLTFPEDC